jgi:tRNA(Ile2) C34 agmatinyltransferase TiaS
MKSKKIILKCPRCKRKVNNCGDDSYHCKICKNIFKKEQLIHWYKRK